MADVRDKQGQLVFGLDIGTRSIVGTVGYLSAGKFHVSAQRVKEHETRAMLDGQIHDIGKVSESILAVKKQLEEDLSRNLGEVCIAAAGRVLRTVTTHVEMAFDAEKEVDQEDVYSLSMAGVEKAYTEFQTNPGNLDMKFYCVGYTPMRYFMNGYQIGNLEGHKAKVIACDLIATFLPDDVVDGLYKSVELADCKVANLTLEPIAAIQVAIPEKFRMLNLALVDVGAGTSDISITKDGTIVAYGMIPVAGDSLTDPIVQHCLVDFEMAESIKRAASGTDAITYYDILGLEHTITPEEVMELLSDQIDHMTQLVADEIKNLNGDKPVSAVFVVGGGGTIPTYTQRLAEKLGIPKERVAIRGQEVMQSIVFENENPIKDSLMVTPIGICMSYYEQSNNFIFVEFNGERLKLYDNGRLTISDAAMQMSFPNEDLFPKRGAAISYTLNGKAKMIRGMQGEPAVITLNGDPSDLYAKINSGDIISIVPSTKGADAVAELGSLTEFSQALHVTVNEKNLELPRTAEVNGVLETQYCKITEGDVIEIHNYYTVRELAAILDLPLSQGITVNGTAAVSDTKVYEDFAVMIPLNPDVVAYMEESPIQNEYVTEREEETVQAKDISQAEETSQDEEISKFRETSKAEESAPIDADKPIDLVPHDLHIICNNLPITMHGKAEYVFVDVFDYITFDLKNPQGRSVVTLLNNRPAEYMELLSEGDVLKVYWD